MDAGTGVLEVATFVMDLNPAALYGGAPLVFLSPTIESFLSRELTVSSDGCKRNK